MRRTAREPLQDKGRKSRSSASAQNRSNPATSATQLCCEVLQGVRSFACQELLHRFGKRVSILPSDDPETIFLRYHGDIHELLRLRTIVAVYLVQHFPVPRPRALLGQQHFQALLQQIETVRRLYPAHIFTSFRVSAAGEDSSTFARIKAEISQATGLTFDPGEGEMFLRIRPSSLEASGWELLTRISPRPLSVRPWRVHNMEGALNATIAAVMIEMTSPRPNDRFLNLMGGSGTLLIERLLRCPASAAIGCDIDAASLASAKENLRASKLTGPVELLEMDATALQFPASAFNAICADLPWGQLVGSHWHNVDLYPQVLAEAARVTTLRTRLALLTHEIKLFESILQNCTEWILQDVVKIFQGGLHPRIYLFQRAASNRREVRSYEKRTNLSGID
jgi:tRNA (guanine6-N2)-methyltransferase